MAEEIKYATGEQTVVNWHSRYYSEMARFLNEVGNGLQKGIHASKDFSDALNKLSKRPVENVFKKQMELLDDCENFLNQLLACFRTYVDITTKIDEYAKLGLNNEDTGDSVCEESLQVPSEGAVSDTVSEAVSNNDN